MEEPFKESVELEEISEQHRDLVTVATIGGRSKSKNLLLISQVLSSAQKQKLEKPDEPYRVVICSSGDVGISRFKEVRRIFEENNIEVVILNIAELSMSKVEGSEAYINEFEDIFSMPREVIKISPIEANSLPYDIIKDTIKYQDRKIPIQGRSSKKGKNNQQFGSKFHK